MSDLYAIGTSGLRAYQGALSVVSENIANAQTAGYTKRTVTLKEHGATSGGIAGSGVYVSAVSRTADAYRAADVRRAGSDLARSETAVQWLQQIETALSAQDVGARLSSFFNAATTMAADPSATTPRAAFLAAAESVSVAFTASGAALNRMSGQLDASARDATATLNGLAVTLDRVNGGLTRTPADSTAFAMLADQRDQLLEQMSALTDANVTIDNFGRATVRLGGPSGPLFVAPDGGAGTLGAVRNPDGTFAFVLDRGATTSSVNPGGGMLAGIADSAQRIVDAKVALDELANDFVTTANDFQAAGRDLDGNAGPPLFAQAGGDPSQVSLMLTDPRKVAAAAPGGGVRDNSNLLALAAARTDSRFEWRATALVGANANALAAARTVAAAQTSIREGAVARYDATAGVDIDNEAVDLMRYQQAYQASARVIQVGREIFQSLLSST